MQRRLCGSCDGEKVRVSIPVGMIKLLRLVGATERIPSEQRRASTRAAVTGGMCMYI